MSASPASQGPEAVQPLMMVGAGEYVCEGDACFVPPAVHSGPSDAAHGAVAANPAPPTA